MYSPISSYFVIYERIDSENSKPFTITENKQVAKHFCENSNGKYFYKEVKYLEECYVIPA